MEEVYPKNDSSLNGKQIYGYAITSYGYVYPMGKDQRNKSLQKTGLTNECNILLA